MMIYKVIFIVFDGIVYGDTVPTFQTLEKVNIVM